MEKLRPTTVIIFGATGDLFRRKLSRAFLDLFAAKVLPSIFNVVGFSRRNWNNEGYRQFVKEVLQKGTHQHSETLVDQFLSHFFYVEGDLGDLKTYHGVAECVARIDHAVGVCTNKLFYLATPPAFYEMIFKNLSHSGLTIPCRPGTPEEEMAWSRILVEKPFGNNLNEAKHLDELLGSLFLEEQIFRIDHYLAKETIQNILSFRFSNAL